MRVVQAPRVRLLATYRARAAVTVSIVAGTLTKVEDTVAKAVSPCAARPAGIFPLRLSWQPVFEAFLRTGPVAERKCVLP